MLEGMDKVDEFFCPVQRPGQIATLEKGQHGHTRQRSILSVSHQRPVVVLSARTSSRVNIAMCGTTDYGMVRRSRNTKTCLRPFVTKAQRLLHGIANPQSAWGNKRFVLGVGVSEPEWIDKLGRGTAAGGQDCVANV